MATLVAVGKVKNGGEVEIDAVTSSGEIARWRKGMDAYLAAMAEAADDGEHVDWNGVACVIDSALQQQRKRGAA